MEILGFLLLGLFIFIILGIGGWIIKFIGYIFDFLGEGCSSSLGCLFWVIIIIVLLLGLC